MVLYFVKLFLKSAIEIKLVIINKFCMLDYALKTLVVLLFSDEEMYQWNEILCAFLEYKERRKHLHILTSLPDN